MAVGVRTEDLRKVYHSAPPMAATGIMARPQEKRNPKQPKPEIKALDGLTLEVKTGEIFGLLGPNGAGKSTTIGIITTRVRATSGHAFVGDHEVWQEQAKVKRLIGVVPQRPNLDFSLTASEILVFHAAYFGIPPKEGSRRAAELLEKFKLTDRAGQLVRGFSGGMMQRMSIARAMMHDPEVLFLDEPSAGLDPQTRILLWEIIREYNELGKTVVLTTHNMEEADALCQRLVIVDHGRVIAQGTPAALKQSIPGGFLLRLHFARQTPELIPRLQSLAGVREVRALQTASKGALDAGGNGTATAIAEPSGVDIYADRGGSLIPEVASLAVATGAELSDVHISEPSLENLFLHHTGRSLRD